MEIILVGIPLAIAAAILILLAITVNAVLAIPRIASAAERIAAAMEYELRTKSTTGAGFANKPPPPPVDSRP